MVVASMDEIGSPYDLFDDGDDCILFLRPADLARVKQILTRHFLEYGQEMKIENVSRNIDEIKFCQHRVLEVAPGMYTLCPDPFKVMRVAYTGVEEFNDPNLR